MLHNSALFVCTFLLPGNYYTKPAPFCLMTLSYLVSGSTSIFKGEKRSIKTNVKSELCKYQ